MHYIKNISNNIVRNVSLLILTIFPVILQSYFNLQVTTVLTIAFVGASLYIYSLDLSQSNGKFDDLDMDLTKENAHHEDSDLLDSMVSVIKSSSDTIDYSTQTMAEIMEQTESCASNITIMMDGVSNMAHKNAQLSEESSQHMNLLDQHLDEIYTFTRNLDEVSADTQSSSSQGHQVVQELIDQSGQTVDVIESLGQSVRDIADQMKDMNKITEAILAISNKTQLLALNAAIESARAGEHGRGFAVVANEIGLLADQSKVSSTEIQTMINGISNEMYKSLGLIDNVEDALDKQITSVTSTLNAFSTIGSSITEIGGGIDTIGDLIIQVRGAKDELSKILKQVARSSKLTSSTTQQVTASNMEQTTAFTRISDLCSELQVMSQTLQMSTSQIDQSIAV